MRQKKKFELSYGVALIEHHASAGDAAFEHHLAPLNDVHVVGSLTGSQKLGALLHLARRNLGKTLYLPPDGKGSDGFAFADALPFSLV